MQLCVDASTSQYHSWRFMYLSNQILWVMIKDFWCWCIPGFVTDVLDISHHPSPPPPKLNSNCFCSLHHMSEQSVYPCCTPLHSKTKIWDTHPLSKTAVEYDSLIHSVVGGNKQNRVSEYDLRNLRWWAEVQLRSLFFWDEAQTTQWDCALWLKQCRCLMFVGQMSSEEFLLSFIHIPEK
jgi:hypothetical protein